MPSLFLISPRCANLPPAIRHMSQLRFASGMVNSPAGISILLSRRDSISLLAVSQALYRERYFSGESSLRQSMIFLTPSAISFEFAFIYCLSKRYSPECFSCISAIRVRTRLFSMRRVRKAEYLFMNVFLREGRCCFFLENFPNIFETSIMVDYNLTNRISE